jgi:anti-anti-sigma regulatory factor
MNLLSQGANPLSARAQLLKGIDGQLKTRTWQKSIAKTLHLCGLRHA